MKAKKTTVTTKVNGFVTDSHTYKATADIAMLTELFSCHEWGGYSGSHNSRVMSLYETGKALAHYGWISEMESI